MVKTETAQDAPTRKLAGTVGHLRPDGQSDTSFRLDTEIHNGVTEMPSCKIIRYARGCRTEHTFLIPQRVTLTGKENHLDRAYDDAALIMEGMGALDKALFDQSEDPNKGSEPARYWMQSVSLD